MTFRTRTFILGGATAAALAALAACAPKAPPPPPPPPPVVIKIPPRPAPPSGVSASFLVPAVGPDGVRMTVNAHLTPVQRTWNFRSAYNVAALNCQKPQHAGIVAGYRAFITKHTKVLTTANRGVDADFKARFGPRFIAPREAYMTQVYNYFAFPPTLDAFCDAAMVMNAQSAVVASKDVEAFAAAELPKIEAVFEGFFRTYDQYLVAAAAWDSQYGPPRIVPAAIPAPVAVPMAPASATTAPSIRTQR